uniref:Uncharacterized protein n=1 Tax=Arundo donax TaxID=35708 RepID=A0A0A9AQS0_ARUDO
MESGSYPFKCICAVPDQEIWRGHIIQNNIYATLT